MMKYIKLIVLFIGILMGNLAVGQNGYVVLLKGDTIKGNIKYLNYANSKNVQVAPVGGKKKVYNLMQVKAFKMDNDTYLNIRTSDNYTFMRIIKSGYLSYYAYQLPTQSTWDGRYLQKKDGSGVDLPNLGFKKILSRYLSDCEEVAKDIETRELTKTKLDQIIDEYNQCIANRSKITPSPALQSNQSIPSTTTALAEPWKELENAVNKTESFEGKESALDIINDIKLKVLRNEKVSNFLINGLKESLTNQPQLKNTLDLALQTLTTK